MPLTYTYIAKSQLTTTTSLVQFQNIPQTYDDLLVVISARSNKTSSATPDYLLYYFNGDTNTNYSMTQLYGNGSTAASNRQTSATNNQSYSVNSDGGTASTFSNLEIYIPAYRASQNKPISVSSVTENNTTGFVFTTATANLYRSNTAISSMVIQAVSYDFVSASSFWLYGIKNS